MKKYFDSGYAFFFVTFVFFVVSVLSKKATVYLSIGVVFFIIGLAVRKKNAQKKIEQTQNK